MYGSYTSLDKIHQGEIDPSWKLRQKGGCREVTGVSRNQGAALGFCRSFHGVKQRRLSTGQGAVVNWECIKLTLRALRLKSCSEPPSHFLECRLLVIKRVAG